MEKTPIDEEKATATLRRVKHGISFFLNVFLHVISSTSWIVLIPRQLFFPVCQMAEPTWTSFDEGVNLEVLCLVFLSLLRNPFSRVHVLFITVLFHDTPIHLLKNGLVSFVYCCLGVDTSLV